MNILNRLFNWGYGVYFKKEKPRLRMRYTYCHCFDPLAVFVGFHDGYMTDYFDDNFNAVSSRGLGSAKPYYWAYKYKHEFKE